MRIDGQHSVYIPVLKQGGDSNTIAIVNGIKTATKHLTDIPESLRTAVVFDQSVFVKIAIKNLLKEGGIGLALTAVMILFFLGSPRATFAVLLSIPLSALTCLLIISGTGGIDQHDAARRIGARLFALDRRFRRRARKHLPLYGDGSCAARSRGERRHGSCAGGAGGDLTTSIVFFPVTLFYGVSKYLFVDSLSASCSRFSPPTFLR